MFSHTAIMGMSAPDIIPFSCPHCAAPYKLVHVEAGEIAGDPEITCLRCGGPLLV